MIPKTKNWKGPVQVTNKAKEDLKMWIQFLEQYNGVTFFRALRQLRSDAINLQADASKAGYGATFRNMWIQEKFPQCWVTFNIAVLEFFPILVLVDMFAKDLANATVIFHTDNQAVCDIINEMTSKHAAIIILLRKLLLLLLKNNIDLRAVHVAGKNNVLCDAISRSQVNKKLLDEYGMLEKPEKIPAHLHPELFELGQA